MIVRFCDNCRAQIARPLYPSLLAATNVRFCNMACRRQHGEKQKNIRAMQQPAEGGTKQCLNCGGHHPHEFFSAERLQKDGRARWCKQCMSVYSRRRYRKNIAKEQARGYARILKYRHGLSVEQFDALKAAQGGGCAICGDTTGLPGKNVRLYVDHNHATGALRGLLCQRCNAGLGLFADDLELLRSAVALHGEILAAGRDFEAG